MRFGAPLLQVQPCASVSQLAPVVCGTRAIVFVEPRKIRRRAVPLRTRLVPGYVVNIVQPGATWHPVTTSDLTLFCYDGRELHRGASA